MNSMVLEKDDHNWIIHANLNDYELHAAFKKFRKIDWHISNSIKNIQMGDIVYIYVGLPEKSIRYKCKVTKINVKSLEIDDREFVYNLSPNKMGYFETEKIKAFPVDKISIDMLREHGVKKNIQGPQRLYRETLAFIQDNE